MSTINTVRKLIKSATSFLAVVALGCAATEPQDPHYDNTFWNVTSDRIYGVQIDWDAGGKHFQQHPGEVPVAVYHFIGKSMVEAPYPIPEKATVNWRTKDGKSHHQSVQVASFIPDIEHFKGSIFYQFTDQGVKIIPYTYAYQEENVEQGKAAVP